MTKQEMNRSFAFAFADYRQQVLIDICIMFSLQCIDFPITSFLMIELTIINKTLTEIVKPDVCISSHKIITNVYFSPTEPSPVLTEIPSTFRPRLFPVQKVFARN